MGSAMESNDQENIMFGGSRRRWERAGGPGYDARGPSYAALPSFCLFQLSMTILNLRGWIQSGRP